MSKSSLRGGARVVAALCLGLAAPLASLAQDAAAAPPAASQAFAAIDAGFADYQLSAHIPGLVYGIVAEGRLVHVRAFGVQDLESKRPVTPETLFRIASMTKAFTALTVLKLRDDGKLRLDDAAEQYVPELRGWTYPTLDSPRIRVRDLLNHTAGFVTDDPWGDRQQPLTEAAFTQLLRDGVPFARTPELAMEYSNLGYAILGRVIGNGRPYAETITRSLLEPLGMASSSFEAGAAPAARRAQGYGWQDDRWTQVPTMAHGAFGAMGGVQTSAVDYARWVAFLLAAWPARDDAERGPVRRATVRELAQGSNFPVLRAPRPGAGPEACRRVTTYGMGMTVVVDCEVGLHLTHGGGYPGYGSYVLLLPQHGVGIFAFANRTYSAPIKPIYDAVSVLRRAGWLKEPALPAGSELERAYAAVRSIYEQADVAAAGDLLAMNFLLDRDGAAWQRELGVLRKRLGECDTGSPVVAASALEGRFSWPCALGRLSGHFLLAPTRPARIQSLELSARPP